MTTLARLRQQHPEWVPWLAVVERAIQPAGSAAWDALVPAAPVSRPPAPLLANASIGVARDTIRTLLEALVTIASSAGSPEMTTLRRMVDADAALPRLFQASIAQRRTTLDEIATRTGTDREALEAVAGLVAVPFLQACHRRWSASITESWVEPYCPVCGAWPAFAEIRGIERTRVFRCGRCGAGWHAHHLRCPYCAMDDHEELVTLVPEQGDASGAIEACRSCLGYVKTVTRLQGCPAEAVVVDDLATVHLDLAAVSAGYSRPLGAGYPVDLHVL